LAGGDALADDEALLVRVAGPGDGPGDGEGKEEADGEGVVDFHAERAEGRTQRQRKYGEGCEDVWGEAGHRRIYYRAERRRGRGGNPKSKLEIRIKRQKWKGKMGRA
jgi:hypothetical protein